MRLTISFIIAAALAACDPGMTSSTSADVAAQAARPRPLQIRTLDNRADLISGGDAYVELVFPDHAPLIHLEVLVGDRDVTGAFARRADGRVTGLITGLAVGANVVTASSASTDASSLTITNHPIGGSVYSGPQILPFVCATPVAIPATPDTAATNASGLST